jgi:hypothetical protein
MNYLAASREASDFTKEIVLEASPPNVFIGGPVRIRLDSRLKHAGMTDFGRSKLRGINPRRLKVHCRWRNQRCETDHR